MVSCRSVCHKISPWVTLFTEVAVRATVICLDRFRQIRIYADTRNVLGTWVKFPRLSPQL